jgi:hypothetical protein
MSEENADFAAESDELEASEVLDTSHDLDMETVFASDAHNAEMLATGVRSILEAQEIPSILVSGSQFPSLPFEVRVPRARLEEARAALQAAEEAGPAAAEEAERQYELSGGSESEVT